MEITIKKKKKLEKKIHLFLGKNPELLELERN